MFDQQIGSVSIALCILAVWFVLSGYMASSSGLLPHGVRMGLLAASYIGYPIWAVWIGRQLAMDRPVATVAGGWAERGLAAE